MSQLLLFEDTDGRSSFVARPLGTTADGLHTLASGRGNQREALSAATEKAEQADCSLTSGYSESLLIDGSTYEPEHDKVRLGKQALAVFELMRDGQWRNLFQIAKQIGCGSEAGISARLRDFRKKKFGGHVVNRRRAGEAWQGVFEYQLIEGRA